MSVRDGWKNYRLSEIAELNPRRPSSLISLDHDTPVTFVPMASVCEHEGVIKEPIVRTFGEVRKGFTSFADRDVIFAKITPCMQNGKSAIAGGLTNGIGFGSTEFHVIRPSHLVLPEWIYHFVRQQPFRAEAAKNFRGSAGQQRVPEDFLAKQTVPVPDLETQRRIVARIQHCFSRLDEMEKLQTQMLKDSKRLPLNYFRHTYERLILELPTRPLREIAAAQGGGTPSRDRKDYWAGGIPWVSPKDMKIWEIFDAQEHVSPEAIARSAAKLIDPPAVLFVVRGMILAHTLPIAVTRVPVAINQDMKALIPHSMSAEFLAAMLLGASASLLRQVEIAGHGTRRLQTEKWSDLPIPVPGKHEARLLAEFQKVRDAAREIIADTSSSQTTHLRTAILREAFAGRL